MPRKNKPGAGRPKIEIDTTMLANYASIGCTDEEMATLLGCSSDTLVNNFSEIIEEGRSRLNMSLRRSQVKKALAGDNSMLIWLGKNRLGQRDRTDLNMSGEMTSRIVQVELPRKKSLPALNP